MAVEMGDTGYIETANNQQENNMNADNIKEMLDNWTKVELAARKAYPEASEEEIYKMVSEVMNKSLGFK